MIAIEAQQKGVPDDSDDDTPQQRELRATIALKHSKKEKKKNRGSDDEDEPVDVDNEDEGERDGENVDMGDYNNDSLYDAKW